jgi:branched-chain amino acid transport system substrate-binding protein
MTTATRRTVMAGGAAILAAPAIGRAQSAPVKVGVLLPTSGILAYSGQVAARGIKLGAALGRESGGPAIEIVSYDTQSKPETGRLGVESLIREGCSVLIGAWDSAATISAAQACEAAKVPLVINIASAPQITEQGFTQVFRNFTPAGVLIRNAVQRIKEATENRTPQPRTAVVLYANDTFGNSILGALDKLWVELGVPIKILDRIGYDEKARDLSVEVAKAKATGADIVLPITRVNDAVAIVREMVKQRWNPLAIMSPGSPGPYEKSFTDALGKYADDYMVSVPWYDPKNPATLKLVARFETENPGQRFELNAGFSCEAVQIVLDALARAKSAEPAAIHAALRTTHIVDHPMYGGPIAFDAKGQNNNIGCVLLQDRDGQPLVVGPAEVAVAQARYPLLPFDKR